MRIFIVTALLLTGACSADVPDGYQPPSLETAVQAVLSFWGKQGPTGHQPFYLVKPNCAPFVTGEILGFIDPASGACLTGLQVEGGMFGGDSVYVSPQIWNTYSGTALCHEALHTIIGDPGHTDKRWGSRDEQYWPQYSGELIRCREFLWNMPDIDVIEPVKNRPVEQRPSEFNLQVDDECVLIRRPRDCYRA
jgi:hypothetical protein